MAGITDSLLRSTVLARERDGKYPEELQSIKEKVGIVHNDSHSRTADVSFGSRSIARS